MEFIFIYTTTPNEKEAKKIARHLLERKLVACANIFPIESMYWWEGKITEDQEHTVILKTKENSFKKIKQEIEQIHSYSVPCIIKIAVEPNEKYRDWLEKQLGSKSL